MTIGAPRSFGAQLKALREAAGFTQEELATIAGLSVHAVSALERGERRRPHPETVRALSAALDLTGAARDALAATARAHTHATAVDELSGGSLPRALTALLGRDADVATLRQWLEDPAVRLVTLTGPGGVGKTRVALEIAHTFAAGGVTRVVFVPLAAIREPAFVGSAIAEAVGLADTALTDLPKRLRIACGDHPTMLVLDNFEQVLHAAPLVVDLLSSIASLRVLATSRAALRVRGEREHVIGPLQVDFDSEATSPADLARSPAVRLFVERIRDVQPDFRLTVRNSPIVAAICQRLDGLPLALELAAPWLKVLTAETLLHRLAQDPLQSTVVPRDLPERQQTMNATIAWSYQLLDPDEQRAFRRFGVLSGLFPIDAAAAVLGGREATTDDSEALRAAAGLIDKSLLVRAQTSVVPTCSLYQMLETVRAYAALELAASGEQEEAHEGLVRYCTGEASLAASGLVGPAQIEWLHRVREDLESYRGALAWLIDHDRALEATHIAWSLQFFWLIRGYAAEGLRWYEQIARLPSLTSAAESRALVGAAVMCYTQGEQERARTALMRARALADSVGDVDTVAQVEHVLGHVEYAVGNITEAERRFTHSIEAFGKGTIPWGAGLALSGMAEVALAMGDADKAERLLEEAASELRNAGPWFMSLGSYVRAVLAVRRGAPDHAVALVRENLTRIRDLHDRFAFVYTVVPLAAAAVLKGDDAWAARILGARDAMMERTGVALVDTRVHDLRQQAEEAARERLGRHRWALAHSAGRRMSIDAMLNEIDDALRRRVPADAESAE
jgi:predicted ATPase/DNA-binding XRE family transcriptional regulator